MLPNHRGFHLDQAEFHVRLARAEIEASAIETDEVQTAKNAPPVASGREPHGKPAVTTGRKKGKVRASFANQREVEAATGLVQCRADELAANRDQWREPHGDPLDHVLAERARIEIRVEIDERCVLAFLVHGKDRDRPAAVVDVDLELPLLIGPVSRAEARITVEECPVRADVRMGHGFAAGIDDPALGGLLLVSCTSHIGRADKYAD